MIRLRRILGLILTRPVAALLRLFLAQHVAQRIEAGGIGVALGVLVGQARLWIVQRTALLFASIDPDRLAAHAPTAFSASALVRQRQPMSSLVSVSLMPLRMRFQKKIGANAMTSPVMKTSVM